VAHRLEVLRHVHAMGDGGEMMFALRAELLRSLGNLTQVLVPLIHRASGCFPAGRGRVGD
jgi:hypothetical protein